jgi:hypothetical protein
MPLQEALFAVRREAYPRYKRERVQNHVVLKMEAICSSETSVLTRATQYKVPADVYH